MIVKLAVGAFSLALHGVFLVLMTLFNPLHLTIAIITAIGIAALQATDVFTKSFNSAFEKVKSGYEAFKFAIMNGKLEDAFKIVTLTIKGIWADLMEYLYTTWKAFENMFLQGISWVYSLFNKDVSFDKMSQTIDDMMADDVVKFRQSKKNYEKEISDLVSGIKAQKAEKADNEESGGKLGISNDLLDSLKKLPAVEFEMKDKIANNPTFGALSLDAINYGAPTFEINKQMLKKLDKIEQNTRNDDDDDAITVY